MLRKSEIEFTFTRRPDLIGVHVAARPKVEKTTLLGDEWASNTDIKAHVTEQLTAQIYEHLYADVDEWIRGLEKLAYDFLAADESQRATTFRNFLERCEKLHNMLDGEAEPEQGKKINPFLSQAIGGSTRP